MSYAVLHIGCNPSDHSVILAKFATCTRVPGNTEQIVWDKVSAHEIHNYKCTLDTSLSNISLPLDALYIVLMCFVLLMRLVWQLFIMI